MWDVEFRNEKNIYKYSRRLAGLALLTALALAWSAASAPNKCHWPVCQIQDNCRVEEPGIFGWRMAILALRSSLVRIWKLLRKCLSQFRLINWPQHQEYIQAWKTRSLCKDLTHLLAIVQTLFQIEPWMTCEYWNEMLVMMSWSRLICQKACVTWWCILTSNAPTMTLPLDGSERITCFMHVTSIGVCGLTEATSLANVALPSVAKTHEPGADSPSLDPEWLYT